MRNIRVAAVQFQHAPGDKAANLATIGRFVALAAAQQVEIIAFPECCISGYWHLRKLTREELTALAEPVPDGPAAQRLLSLSKKAGMTIGGGLVERDGEKLYNSYFVAMPDGRWARHRKLHVFVSEFLSPGDQYTVFDTPHGCRVGVLICYDNNLVENVRITALAGAEILLAPHQTGGCRSGSPCAMGPIDVSLWQNRQKNPDAIRAEFQGDKGRGWLTRWLPARAHDNGMFLVFANGVGQDEDEVRTGNAMVIDCYGRIVAESKAIEGDLVIADLDASLRDRCTGLRWIKARRPELYQPLTVRTGREMDTRAVRFEYDS
ncbi:MAG: nitrilase family protein [Planctomycetia bacterium]|nr:nitrilase family protein [Planctomycetia bacterium]